MQKLMKKIFGFIATFVVSVFLLILIFLNQIKSGILSMIGAYGYYAVLLVTLMVEFLAQPIGPEAALLAGRILGLNAIFTALITIVGSTMASFINLKIGRILHDKFFSEKKYDKYIKWYKKHGKYGLLVAALGPVPYVPFCWLSGGFNMTTKKFIYFGLLPRIARIIVITAILWSVF